MKVLESRRQKIRIQLMERDRSRIRKTKKKTSVHKSKDLPSPQRYLCNLLHMYLSLHAFCVFVIIDISPNARERKSVKELQTKSDVMTKSTQHLANTSREGCVLHFTLNSLQPNGTPLIINIPSNAMATIPASSPIITGIATTVHNTPVVTEDHPVSIPYNGKCLMCCECIIMLWYVLTECDKNTLSGHIYICADKMSG